MPIVSGKYVNPGWFDDTTPDIDAVELNAISDTLECVPVENGGTGETTKAGIRNSLGLGNTTGALPIANGGTGATTEKNARRNLGWDVLDDFLPISLGGTGANTVWEARTNLGFDANNGALPFDLGGTGTNEITRYYTGKTNIYTWGPVAMLVFRVGYMPTDNTYTDTIPDALRPVENIFGCGPVYASTGSDGQNFAEGYAQAFLSSTTGVLTVKIFSPSTSQRTGRLTMFYIRKGYELT